MAKEKKTKPMRIFKYMIRILLIFILLSIMAIGYAFFIEPQLLIVRDHTMKAAGAPENAGQASAELKVVQISDIHISKDYGEQQLDRLVEKVNGIKPDIIVFTGDLYDNYSIYGAQDEVGKKLNGLKAEYGKYAIWGNRDYGGGASRIYENLMNEAGFRLLKNEALKIKTEGGHFVSLGGVDDFLLGNPKLAETADDMPDADYKILLMHEPDKAMEIKDGDVDLILTGHSHGGQVRIPFMKVITTALAEKYISGFYNINPDTGLRLYVNTGLGTTRIPARFLVPPSISVFHITF